VYRILTRQMSERELQIVREQLHPSFFFKFAATLGGIFAGLAVLCYGLSLAFKPESAGSNWLVVSSLVLAGWTGAVLLLICGQAVKELVTRRKRRMVVEVITDGRVEVEQIEATAVAALPENPRNRTEGPGFFFDIGEGKVFCLRGEECYRDPDGPLPNTRFEVVRTVKHGVLLGVFCSGHELVPVRQLDKRTFNYDHLYASRVFAGTLATLEEDLRGLAAESGESSADAG